MRAADRAAGPGDGNGSGGNGKKPAPGGGATPESLRELSERFEGRDPGEVLDWAVERFAPALTLACSFGMEDVVLVDLLARRVSSPDIFYLDTAFLFPETLATRDRLAERYGIAFREIRPLLTAQEQARVFGEDLPQRAPSQCCWLRKVEPLRRALAGYAAWVTGIRREQASTRAGARVVEWDDAFGLVKINPLAAWTWHRVRAHVRARGIPYNPLHDRGYPSVGCMPCTSPVAPGEEARAGRWRGRSKVECGLHPGQGGLL